MSGAYEITAGETRSPTAYARRAEGDTWLAGRDFPGKEAGERLMEAPDLKVHKDENGNPFLRRPNGQTPTKEEKRQFIESKGFNFKRDSLGRWQDEDGVVSNEDVYNKLKFTGDEVARGKSGHKRRQTNNFVSSVMDKQGWSESKARSRINEFRERRKKIQQMDIPKSEKQDRIHELEKELISPTP